MRFIKRFTDRLPTVYFALYRMGLAEIPVSELVQLADDDAHLHIYQPIVTTRFIGHAVAVREGEEVPPDRAQVPLNRERAPDPETSERVYGKHLGGIKGAGEDHSVRTYVSRVFWAAKARDHLYGRAAAFQGWATRIFHDGRHYEGEWRDGKRHGWAIETLPDGGRYEGEWRDDKRHGWAIETLPDGGRYEGEWRDDKRHGWAIETLPDGGRYAGLWRDNNRHGWAIETLRDGGRYEGEWRDGKRHGWGIYTWPDGGRYEGEWRFGHYKAEL